MPVTVFAPPRGTAIVEEGLELLAAFSQITDPVVRRTVIGMVQGLRAVRTRGDESALTVSIYGRRSPPKA